MIAVARRQVVEALLVVLHLAAVKGQIPDVAGWMLEYVENFDCGALSGGQLNASVWERQLGDGSEYGIPGWGNNEPQYYTDRPENSATVPDPLAEDGCALKITADRGPLPYSFTSARVRAQPTGPLGALQPTPPASGSGASLAVRVAARIMLPEGSANGVWPAFWMLPTPFRPGTINNEYGSWAASGEIDIMEARNTMVTTVSTIHFGGPWPNDQHISGELGGLQPSPQSYHTYVLEWSHEKIRMTRDDVLVSEILQAQWFTDAVPKATNPAAPFDKPFYVLLNLAVGGTWPGQPTPDDLFPQHFYIDYVSVHRQVPAA